MNTTINRQQWQEEEALRRFQLISPLLQTGLDDAKRIQLRKMHTATFRGRQGRVLRPDRAILSGQF